MRMLDCTLVLGLGLMITYHLTNLSRSTDDDAIWSTDKYSTHSSCEAFISSTKLPDWLRMATKRPYSFTAVVTDESKIGHCTANALYAVFRHGTRYPSPKYISKWNTFEHHLKDHMNLKQPITSVWKFIQNWNNPFSVEHGQLTSRGMWEHFCLAKRFQQRLPSLLNKSYSGKTYSFRATQTPRAVKSALSFAHGLFTGEGTLPYYYNPIFLESASLTNDTLLRFFDLKCPLYDKQVENNQSLTAMLQKYWDSEAARSVLRNLQHKLDPVEDTWIISSKDAMTMYRLCLHETGVFGSSQWCDLLSEEDQKALEYYLDMKTYWKRGAGFAVNWQRAYPLISDILNFVKQSTTHGEDPTFKRALFRFAHAETIIPLMVYFGFFNDTKQLLPDNYLEMKGRSFVSEHIAPFSGNIAFVVYDCGENSRIRVLVNEKDYTPFMCRHRRDIETTLCTVREFEEVVNFRMKNNWSKLCSLERV